MSVKYTTKKYMESLLDTHPEWNILDLACGRTAGWPQAQTLFDIQDHSKSYPEKRFVQGNVEDPLPFEDNEFDFIIASHIAEHVSDPQSFCKEVARVARQGYVEVPTPLFDNLLVPDGDTDPLGHKWWVTFDASTEKIVFRPIRKILLKSMGTSELNLLYPFFRNSIVNELYWHDEIGVEMGNEVYEYEGKSYDLATLHITPWRLGSGE